MPKPLKIMIEVEEALYGKVWRALDNMPGVASLMPVSEGVKGAGSTSGAKVLGKRGTAGGSSACIVLGVLASNKADRLTREQLVPALESAGRKASTIGGVMQDLYTNRQIRRIGKGKSVTYQITATGLKRWNTACQIETGEG